MVPNNLGRKLKEHYTKWILPKDQQLSFIWQLGPQQLRCTAQPRFSAGELLFGDTPFKSSYINRLTCYQKSRLPYQCLLLRGRGFWRYGLVIKESSQRSTFAFASIFWYHYDREPKELPFHLINDTTGWQLGEDWTFLDKCIWKVDVYMDEGNSTSWLTTSLTCFAQEGTLQKLLVPIQIVRST